MTKNHTNPTSIPAHVNPPTVSGENAEREIRDNIRRFNLDLPEYTERAIKIAKQATYWVFDEHDVIFGPSKFVAFRNMNFGQYETSFIGNKRESTSGGGKAHLAIEKAFRKNFQESESLVIALRAWFEARFGQGAPEGLESSKWRFVRIACDSDYRAQGLLNDAAARVAVEQYAQSMAEDDFLRPGYDVVDVSRTHSYDLLCTKNSDELHVEVKGTTGNGETVILTRREVNHAREHCPGNGAATMALVIVHNIQLDFQDGIPVASGGKMQVWQPWNIDDGALTATQFEYRPNSPDRP